MDPVEATFSTTTTAGTRDATKPLAGGARAGVWTMLLAYIAARAAAMPADPALGDIAGNAVHAYGPEVIAGFIGALGFAATAARKKVQTWVAESGK